MLYWLKLANPFIETFAPKGIIEYRIIQDGKIIKTYRTKNLIVTSGRSALAHLLAGDDQSNHYVTTVQFGTGTTPPSITDTGLENSVLSKSVSYSYPDSQTVRFEFSLLQDEGNGYTISELGLFTPSEMFNRVTIEPFTKSSSFYVEFYWWIIFGG